MLVTAFAATVLAATVSPGLALAKDPPGLGRFMNAVGRIESGGRYTARNRISGAYGKYQIMPSNWSSWARRYLHDPHARQTARNQEIVARGKFRDLYRWVGSWRRVAYWWLTGSSRPSGWSIGSRRYVDKVMRAYVTASPGTPAVGRPIATTVHYSERSSQVDLHGPWRSAEFGAYAGDHVAYATGRGATATVRLTGRSVTWYGPLGPTRGRARILVDGRYSQTVDLYRRGFAARAAIFTKRWTTSGSHTLTIEVAGTNGRPMVAIDEFVVHR